MRKLKLQMQISLDGFVAGPEGQSDWMWTQGEEEDKALMRDVIGLADTCDTILLGSGMIREFINHWENVVDNLPASHEHDLAVRMVNMRKIVFSRTQTDIQGRNLELQKGELAEVVQTLKAENGKDIMVYGGARFAGSLISLNLVDEYHFFRNPVAIGNGLAIFSGQKIFKPEASHFYENGKELVRYLPV